MKLVSLSLKLFRQHRNTELSFPDGLTGIIGPNGAGKSTLVEAISFALYGSKSLRGKMDSVRTARFDGKEATSVILLFEHDGKTYRVERTLSDAKLFSGGESKPFATGHRVVTERISHVISMEYDEFLATYFTEQKGLEFLSGKKGQAERERFIVRMMGYDKLEKVQELLRTDKRDRKNQILGWESGIGTREEIEKRLEVEKRALAKAQKDQDEAKSVLKKAEIESERAKKAFDAQEQLRVTFEGRKREVETAKARLDESKEQLENLFSEQKTLAGSAVVKKHGSNFKEVIASKAAEKKKLETEWKALSKELKIEESAWSENLATAKAELTHLKHLVSDAKDKGKSFQKLGESGECPTCGQELGKSFGDVKKVFKKDLGTIEAKLKKAESNSEAAGKEPSRLSGLKKKLKTIEAAGTKLSKAIEELRQVEQEIAALARVEKEATKGKERVGDLEKELARLTKYLGEVEFNDARYRGVKGKYDSSSRLVEVSRLQRVKLEGLLETKSALLKRTAKDLDEFDKKTDALAESKKRMLVLEESDQALTDFRKYLNASIRPRLADLASEFLVDLTDGRYTTVDIGLDFSPTVLEDGEPKEVISGGEEDILNLCVRLALSQMLAERAGHSFSLLILDEVFGSLDENRRNSVLGLLEKLNNRFEQILIITHLDDIKDGVQNLIYVDYEEASGEMRIGKELIELVANG